MHSLELNTTYYYKAIYNEIAGNIKSFTTRHLPKIHIDSVSLIDKTIFSETGQSPYGSDVFKATLSLLTNNSVTKTTILDGNLMDYIQKIFSYNNQYITVGMTGSQDGCFSDNKKSYSVWLGVFSEELVFQYNIVLNPNASGWIVEAEMINNTLYLVYDDVTNDILYKIKVEF